MSSWSVPAGAQPTPVGPAYRHGERRPPAVAGPVGAWLAAVPVGGVIGVALGWWCRHYAGQPSVNGVLADLGAPWIATAFVAGALVMVIGSGRRAAAPLGSAFAGAVAGSACLVAATVVYYGPARTGRLDVSGAGSSAVVWTVVGVGVGVVFGAFGALWWSAPTRAQAAVCLVAVGTAITSEAYYLLDVGAGDTLVRHVLVAVAITGAAVPLLLGVRWHAVAGIVAVAVVALPGSLAAEIVSRGALDSVTLLRDHVLQR